MKKYKVHFSFFNLLTDSQAEVVKLQQMFKALTLLVAGGTYMGSDASHTLLVGIGGFVVDTLLSCLYFEEKK